LPVLPQPDTQTPATLKFDQLSKTLFSSSKERPRLRYTAEKERIAKDVIAGLEQRFPGISAQVEMRDVATPVTWERYTGNWRGAYGGGYSEALIT
jgi:phytoene dehydrogenase-like protein